MGALFILSGPSGVGKGTLVKPLVKEDDALSLSVSCTTRSPRAGERDGVDYFFLTKEEFLKRREDGDFLEWDEHFGNFYGTPKSFVLEKLKTKSVILEIDVEGAYQARDALKDTSVVPVLIMIVPPDLETLKSRLIGRASESEEELQKRIERVQYELAQAKNYDYTVVNDDLNQAKKTLKIIIKQEIGKRSDRL